MGRPRLTSEPRQITIATDKATVETLDLIGRASPLGKPARAEMIRMALREFIENRMANAEVKSFVESRRTKQPLRLHRTDAEGNDGVAGH